MYEWLLKLIPAAWRESVARDLNEEASRAGRTGLRREAWLVWHVVRVAARFRQRDWTAAAAAPRRRSLMNSFGSDLRFALRLLLRQRGSSAAIVTTLALGIGIVTAVYAVFNHVLFRPVPGVRDDGRLVTMLFHPPGKLDHLGAGSPLALPMLRQASTLESVASNSEIRLPVAAAPNADPDVRYVQFVTSRFFDVLGVRARHGRLFSDEEAESTAAIALLSDSFWVRELGADKAALGRSLVVNGQPFTILGIVDSFRGWDASRVGQVDVWLPMGVHQMTTKSTSADQTLGDVIARRRADATLDAVSVEVQGIYSAASGSFDEFTRQFVPVAYSGLYSFGQDRFHVAIMRTFPFLMGGAVLLLLVACANTANRLLARLRRRMRELALQAALGASRLRLVRGLLVEAVVLAAVASVAGLALAVALTRALRGLQIFASVPEVVDLALDARVAVFAIGVAAATVLLFGLLPAVRASRADVRTLLPSTSLATPRSRRVRMALVASQLAISLTLLGAAGVLARSLANLRSQDVGMHTDDVVSFSINPRLLGFNAARRDQLVRDLMTRLEGTPGIDAVAWASPPAFWGSGRTARGIRLDAATPHPELEVETMTVSGSFFGVLGIPLIEGRPFRPDEFQQAPQKSGGTAIVSASLARALFGAQPAVGRRIVRGTWRAATSAVMSIGGTKGEFVPQRELEIVGVAGDTRTGWMFRRGPAQVLYEPGGQQLVYGSFYLRSERPVGEATTMARRVVRDLEPGLPVTDAGTVQQEIERLIPEERLFARVMSIVALLALLLGVAGTYAVMSYTVSERTREFGIRTALGAAPIDIARGVIARAAVMCVCGAVAGLVIFAAASRLLSSRLYGVSALDPATLAGGVGVLMVATLVAAWLPARRATQVDPTIALRTE
jgi:predicted permease